MRFLSPIKCFNLYKIVVYDGQARKQAGNSVPVTMVKTVIQKLLQYVSISLDKSLILREDDVIYSRN